VTQDAETVYVFRSSRFGAFLVVAS